MLYQTKRFNFSIQRRLNWHLNIVKPSTQILNNFQSFNSLLYQKIYRRLNIVKPSTQILNNFHANHFPLQCTKENFAFFLPLCTIHYIILGKKHRTKNHIYIWNNTKGREKAKTSWTFQLQSLEISSKNLNWVGFSVDFLGHMNTFEAQLSSLSFLWGILGFCLLTFWKVNMILLWSRGAGGSHFQVSFAAHNHRDDFRGFAILTQSRRCHSNFGFI